MNLGSHSIELAVVSCEAMVRVDGSGIVERRVGDDLLPEECAVLTAWSPDCCTEQPGMCVADQRSLYADARRETAICRS